MKRRNYAGETYGYLTAIEPTNRQSGGRILWKCSCNCPRYDCAKIVYIATNNFRHGGTKSCKQQRTSISMAIREYYNRYKKDAKRHERLFELSIAEFHSIIRLPCTYCNDKSIKHITRTDGKKWLIKANGIDRVDNTLDYILTNCVPCCDICNYAKRDMQAQMYIDHCCKVAAHNG